MVLVLIVVHDNQEYAEAAPILAVRFSPSKGPHLGDGLLIGAFVADRDDILHARFSNDLSARA
jgi:hypothetical protein